MHAASRSPLYALLYADDGKLTATGPMYIITLWLAFLFLELMEVPMSWKR